MRVMLLRRHQHVVDDVGQALQVAQHAFSRQSVRRCASQRLLQIVDAVDERARSSWHRRANWVASVMWMKAMTLIRALRGEVGVIAATTGPLSCIRRRASRCRQADDVGRQSLVGEAAVSCSAARIFRSRGVDRVLTRRIRSTTGFADAAM